MCVYILFVCLFCFKTEFGIISFIPFGTMDKTCSMLKSVLSLLGQCMNQIFSKESNSEGTLRSNEYKTPLNKWLIFT